MRVNGEGPTPSDLMLVGEAPGRQESECGRPFVGVSGRELNRILKLNGLDRAQMYVTNVVKERPPYVNGKQLPPSQAEIDRDEAELIEELLRVRPKWIGALGRVAARTLTGRTDLDMESSWGLAYPLSVRLREMVRAKAGMASAERETGGYVRRVPPSDVYSGIPGSRVQDAGSVHTSTGESASVGGSGGTGVLAGSGSDLEFGWLRDVRVVPTYHPAAGLRNADIAKFVWRGIEIYGQYVFGRLHPIVPRDEIQTPEYHRAVQSPRELLGAVVACDTEGLPGRVWGGSVSCEPGKATVFGVQSSRPFGQILSEAERIVFHNSLHDVPILEEIGIPVDWSRVEDTYLMAYCLCLVPLGLKPLARRFCGMQMQSYLDVIAPADRKLAMSYVERALDSKKCTVCDGAGKVPVMRKDGKGFKKAPEKCTADGCIDGGLWPERDPQLKYDWDNGTWKITKGWSVGRYLRDLRRDMTAGKYEIEDEETGELRSVRQRITNWPDDIQSIIASEIGELPEPTLDDIDADDATYYSARDADATIRVYPILSQQVDQLELRKAYELDLSVIPVAAEMQKNGMYIDRDYFAKFAYELEHENDKILARLESKCGRPINPSSGDQVAGLLFGDRGLTVSSEDVRWYTDLSFDLEPDKWTKSRSRAAVDDKVLEALKLKHASNVELVELIDLIINYRIRDKILGTYARKLPLMADENGFIHTTIKPCRTATFRWASSDPNLQNISVREKNGVNLGKRVRAGFIAPPGYVLGSWDFCLEPSTKVLKSDLSWVQCANIQEGDELIGFDEDLKSNNRRGSCLRGSKVLKTKKLKKPCFKLTTTHGSVICSDDHMWVVKIRENGDGSHRQWLSTKNIKPGHYLSHFSNTWETDQTREAGYLAGFFDGEGNVCEQTVAFAQNKGETLNKVLELLHGKGFDVGGGSEKRLCQRHWLRGQAAGLRFLGSIRPDRLLHKSRKMWEGRRTWGRNTGKAKVLSVEFLGEMDVVAVETSTKTFIANGFLSHNCQIEMRVLAWYSQDETLLKLFNDINNCPVAAGTGECPCHDIHRLTASRAFRIPPNLVTKEQRTSAKNIGFGVVYGVTAKGLKAQMELRGLYWTEEECQRLIDSYLFEVYPGVGRFMMTAHAEARRFGYVRSLFGHIRYVPGVHSSIASVREEALRQAANFKIQCTAAELLKLSMRTLWNEYRPILSGVGSRLMMAVHDELLLMVPDNEEARNVTDWAVTAAMTNPVILEGVDVGTSGKYGYSWDRLK